MNFAGIVWCMISAKIKPGITPGLNYLAVLLFYSTLFSSFRCSARNLCIAL